MFFFQGFQISPIRIQLDLLAILPKRPFWDDEFTWPYIWLNREWKGRFAWITETTLWILKSCFICCFLGTLSWCFCHASCFCKSFMATEQEKHQRHSFRGACPSLSSFKLFAAVCFVAVEKNRRSFLGRVPKFDRVRKSCPKQVNSSCHPSIKG